MCRPILIETLLAVSKTNLCGPHGHTRIEGLVDKGPLKLLYNKWKTCQVDLTIK